MACDLDSTFEIDVFASKGVFEIGVDTLNRASVIVVIAHRGIETHFFKYFLSLQCCFCLLAISGINIDDGSMPASF